MSEPGMNATPADEAEAQSAREGLDVHAFLAMMVNELAGIAWVKMGLHADPINGSMGKDLDQAKAAVDAVGALAALLEPKLDEDDRRQIRNLVSDLRINFVEKASEAKS